MSIPYTVCTVDSCNVGKSITVEVIVETKNLTGRRNPPM